MISEMNSITSSTWCTDEATAAKGIQRLKFAAHMQTVGGDKYEMTIDGLDHDVEKEDPVDPLVKEFEARHGKEPKVAGAFCAVCVPACFLFFFSLFSRLLLAPFPDS